MTAASAVKKWPTLTRVLGVRVPADPSVIALNRIQFHDALLNREAEFEKELFEYSAAVCKKEVGDHVWFRGIVEFSNVCEKGCHYCGVNRTMSSLHRYTMTREEIVDGAMWAMNERLGTIMLQSGEVSSDSRVEWVAGIAREIRQRTKEADAAKNRPARGLAVALSIGELSRDQYGKLFNAGATRYLLRIESSNPGLYREMHPDDSGHRWETRLRCLRDLRELGFQVGTGVLIGVPGQTTWDLAGDLSFLNEFGADMVGMGPYVPQKGTVLAERFARHLAENGETLDQYKRRVGELTTKMTALARITLGDSNISATTALATVWPEGRLACLKRGANVLMPVITPNQYKDDYSLYEGKRGISYDAEDSKRSLVKIVLAAGKIPALDGEWGDPLRHRRRLKEMKIEADL